MDELRPDRAVFAVTVGTSFANYPAEKLTKHCFKEIPKTNHKMLIEWTSIGPFFFPQNVHNVIEEMRMS